MSISTKANSITYTLAETSDCLKAGAFSGQWTATKGTRNISYDVALPDGVTSVPFCSVDVEGGYCLSVAAGYSSHSVSGGKLTVNFMLCTERTDSVNVTVYIRYLYK